MLSTWYFLTLIATNFAGVKSKVSREVGIAVDQVSLYVGITVVQVAEQHLAGCHLVLITTTRHSPILLNTLSAGMDGVVLVEVGEVFSLDQLDQDHLLQGLWGDTRTTCRALILDLTSTSNNNNRTNLSLSLLERSELWHQSETRVVVVGGKAGVRDVLLHPSLRNTVHALYLAVEELTLRHPSRRAVASDGVWMYQRCMYCSTGEADVQLMKVWKMNLNMPSFDPRFDESMRNMMGHKLSVATVLRFPYIDFKRDTDVPGTTVTPKDSVDARLIRAFASVLNFTFQMREDPGRTWGLEIENGIFNGMVGQLQREERDFSTAMGPTTQRLKVIQYLRGYPSDVLTVTSLKPSLLPQHLSLIRPFAGEMWLALMASVLVWGMILWLLQRVWRWVAGGPGVKFSIALLYGWGAVMEQPPPDPTVSVSGQVLLGWWLVFCLVITTAYRSSLIAHMTVQGKSLPLETFEDLVKQDSWGWGIEPWLFRGIPYMYFSKHRDPVVKEVYAEDGVNVLNASKLVTVTLCCTEHTRLHQTDITSAEKHRVIGVDEALKKVLAGGYSLIHWERYIGIIIASRYTDSYGNTPYHTSRKGISIMIDTGWGVRKGAPFYSRFSQLMSRLEDAGIIRFWTKEVVAGRVKERREATTLDASTSLGITPQDTSQVVLGLQHMQGAFYLLILGFSIASITLLGENLAYICHTP
ncbi:glutamate receptor ionotropic, kainate 2-like [Panulirus ornatus]|uniref:glutamate receptor ionotropic, kainate 2-like n=1 Tax=Panulirus ornatus TaxID=150431 RepID=UPI003A851C8C